MRGTQVARNGPTYDYRILPPRGCAFAGDDARDAGRRRGPRRRTATTQPRHPVTPPKLPPTIPIAKRPPATFLSYSSTPSSFLPSFLPSPPLSSPRLPISFPYFLVSFSSLSLSSSHPHMFLLKTLNDRYRHCLLEHSL